ncbi:MAG: hypothetical protein QOF51_4148 [Chloroflexota bacterium]|jgi:uncharacterized protein (TIGR00303 family)|nr:hypothetical protein [Chloroflexota bacterium]
MDDLLFACADEEGRRLAARLRGQRPLFLCVIASTETALIPGISAAGATTELIPFTAAADAEVLAYGTARCVPGVPSNPLGPPGPALITRAALELASIPHLVVDAGCRIAPDAPSVQLGCQPGGLITNGHAVPNAAALFAAGHALGQRLGRTHPYLVIGESVPGGTTTALALLRALGIAADGRVSSSMAENAHASKTALVDRAMQHLDLDAVTQDPLAAVATLGDPMQATVAGLASGCLDADTPLLLAGGTQMIAVLALLRRLATLQRAPDPSGRIAVATTRWVVEDPRADAIGLQREVGPDPLLATALSFAHARHAGLRRYEEGLVKEGVGAGGAAIAAALCADVRCRELLACVESIAARLGIPE